MIDLTYLKTTTGNDKAVIKQLIELFTSQLPELKSNIVEAFTNDDWYNLKEAAHKAKNSFDIIGASEQAENLKQIEKIALNQKDKTKLTPLIEFFVKGCNEVTTEIENLQF